MNRICPGLVFVWRAALLCAVAHQASANPIFVPDDTYTATKSWERCLVALDAQCASVSCAVGYALTETLVPGRVAARKLNIELPVFVPESMASDAKKTAAFCAPRLEMEGTVVPAPSAKILDPASSRKSFLAPEGVQVALFNFSVDVGAIKRGTTGVFTYRQPLIQGEFVYVPLFENRQDPPSNTEFSFTAFPIGPEALTLKSRNKAVRANMRTRISLDLRHKDVIVVKSI
jgi:hypothetical protein